MKKVTVPNSLEVAFPVALSFYFEEKKINAYKFLYTHTHIYTRMHIIHI